MSPFCALPVLFDVRHSTRAVARERNSVNRHAVAYFFGKDLSMLPQLLLGPFIYCVVFLNITTPRASFGTYYAVLFGT